MEEKPLFFTHFWNEPKKIECSRYKISKGDLYIFKLNKRQKRTMQSNRHSTAAHSAMQHFTVKFSIAQ